MTGGFALLAGVLPGLAAAASPAPAWAWVALGAAAFVLACGWLATRMGTEFIPNLDEGDIAIQALRRSV